MSSDATSSAPAVSIQAMPKSLNRVVVTHYIKAAYGALTGLGLMLFGMISFFEGSNEAMIMGFMFLFIGLGVLVLSLVLNLLAARGLKRMSSGWRIFSIVVSILSLTDLPIGTTLGIIALTGLFATDTQEAFAVQKK